MPNVKDLDRKVLNDLVVEIENFCKIKKLEDNILKNIHKYKDISLKLYTAIKIIVGWRKDEGKSSKLTNNILKLKILDFEPTKLKEIDNSKDIKDILDRLDLFEKNRIWITNCSKIKGGVFSVWSNNISKALVKLSKIDISNLISKKISEITKKAYNIFIKFSEDGIALHNLNLGNLDKIEEFLAEKNYTELLKEFRIFDSVNTKIKSISKAIFDILDSFKFGEYLKEHENEIKQLKLNLGNYEKVAKFLENKGYKALNHINVKTTSEKTDILEKTMFLIVAADNNNISLLKLFQKMSLGKIENDDYDSIKHLSDNKIAIGDKRFVDAYTINNVNNVTRQYYDGKSLKNELIITKL